MERLAGHDPWENTSISRMPGTSMTYPGPIEKLERSPPTSDMLSSTTWSTSSSIASKDSWEHRRESLSGESIELLLALTGEDLLSG